MTDHSVFVIDDDQAMRDSLLMLLRGEGIRAQGFASAMQFLEQLPDDKSACVITDLRMPQIEGSELIQRLKALKGEAWPVIVITGHADVPLAVQLMKAGVVDFIEKPFDPNRILEAVRGCLSALARQGVESEAREQTAARLASLTPRERQVFDALIDGKSNKEIALALDISPRTVEIFRAKVMQKMQAQSLSMLVRLGLSVADA
ncbi:response regulator FixJ [Brevundimonas aurantiaca]|jgi:two-component system response regulator FixJ|uniref:response regulator FixJ n=1 Tax=Brevundimonas aurantiaca TaxID=74316 RepID=UPI001D1917AA|nr:response regulator FixJ [Brevundimonas aurantiaca]MCC4294404.1 response regulator [Brevundimonas aurantiaca]